MYLQFVQVYFFPSKTCLEGNFNLYQLTHVIDTNLRFEAICSFPIGTNHYTSVVDEDVEFGLSCTKQQWVKDYGLMAEPRINLSEELTG